MPSSIQITHRYSIMCQQYIFRITWHDVKVSRPFFSLGLTVVCLGLDLVKFWSQSHVNWSRGL